MKKLMAWAFAGVALAAVADGADVATALGRTNGGLKKALFDGLLHGRNLNCLKERTKVIVLRPLASSN